MSAEDREYFRVRARQEHDRADGARDALVARIHRSMADVYTRRAARPDPLRIDEPA
ncbi:hypothetical protein [Sphingomonas sp. Leaf412]|uniref:hypothetical protein n=1 Tax=Sphingomonas sp. Leaf412 TaxID=1736370 RepID=UPI000B2BF309|nr:hypothetical protein [Sphingomonas sp. Leaf412]